MKRKILLLLSVLAAAAVTGCGGASGYKDGTYEGQSSPNEDDGDYSKVTITVSDNKITACKFDTYEANGELKGEEYAAKSEEAKIAVDSIPEYEKQVLASGDPSLSEVEAISGATLNYNHLNEAVYDALEKAK